MRAQLRAAGVGVIVVGPRFIDAVVPQVHEWRVHVVHENLAPKAPGVRHRAVELLPGVSGMNQRNAQRWESTAALCVQERMARVTGVARPHMTTCATGNRTAGWFSGGASFLWLYSASAEVGRKSGRR